jgi:hypothetical protein
MDARRLHVDFSDGEQQQQRQQQPQMDVQDTEDEEKQRLKARLVVMVREGADGAEYQALQNETSTWLKERSKDEVTDTPGALILCSRQRHI